jgi:hypothetical protein
VRLSEDERVKMIMINSYIRLKNMDCRWISLIDIWIRESMVACHMLDSDMG